MNDAQYFDAPAQLVVLDAERAIAQTAVFVGEDGDEIGAKWLVELKVKREGKITRQHLANGAVDEQGLPCTIYGDAVPLSCTDTRYRTHRIHRGVEMNRIVEHASVEGIVEYGCL